MRKTTFGLEKNLASRNPTERRGTPRNGRIAELRLESGIFRISGPPFRFSLCVAVRGGFVFSASPRWVLGVDGRPFRTPSGTPRNATEPRGAVKLGEMRTESGILRISGSPFRCPFPAAHPRRFRLFRVSALGVRR